MGRAGRLWNRVRRAAEAARTGVVRGGGGVRASGGSGSRGVDELGLVVLGDPPPRARVIGQRDVVKVWARARGDERSGAPTSLPPRVAEIVAELQPGEGRWIERTSDTGWGMLAVVPSDPRCAPHAPPDASLVREAPPTPVVECLEFITTLRSYGSPLCVNCGAPQGVHDARREDRYRRAAAGHGDIAARVGRPA